jgi:hypothetical protein
MLPAGSHERRTDPMLRDGPNGSYRFLPGIPAFSSGVLAMPGWEIVHATLGAPLPWRDGFTRIERHLTEQGRPRTALCGVELRSPAQFTFEGFAAFNDGYRALLAEWKILVGDDNPLPRTNVAPLAATPAEPSLYAFAYTIPGATPAPTFVVAGAGEMGDRARGADGIIRHGETSPDAMREKARFVMAIMHQRMSGLGADWKRVTAIDVYTAQPIHSFLVEEILRPAGPAAIHGVRWFPSRPPIQGLEFEVDLRGVARELVL